VSQRRDGSGTEDTISAAAGAATEARQTVASGAGASADADALELRPVAADVYVERAVFKRGGMGQISTAHDRRLRRTVALKEMRKGSPLEARFEREIRLTARLQHPSIVSVYEAGRWASGDPFYAMELVHGRSFDEVIAGATTLEERMTLVPNVIAVADALGYAHQQGVIHRDLKPSNVMVGEFGETVVIDWGLAKDLREPESAPLRSTAALGHDAIDSARTSHGDVLGTPMYMPPEQARGEPVDARADVYAIGAMLYYVLAGRAPYTGASATDIVESVIASPPTSLLSIEPRLPRDLAAIVEHAMSRQPDARYASARELAADLRRFQAGQMVGAYRYTLGQRVRRWIRRNRMVVGVAAISLVALAALGTFSVRRIVAEREEALAHRADAEGLLGFMLDDLSVKLRPLNRLDLVGDVATRAMDYYARRSSVSVDSKLRNAAALRIGAEVMLAHSDVPAATERITRAIAIVAAIVDREPGNRSALDELARAQHELGDVLETRGDLPGALAQFRESVETARRLDAFGSTAASLQRLAEGHHAVGKILLQDDDFEGALAAQEQHLAVAERLASLRERGGVTVGRARWSIGRVHAARGDRPRAIEAYRSAEAEARRALAISPAQFDARSLLASSHLAIGGILFEQGDHGAALVELEEARNLRQRLVDDDPSNTLLQRDLASAHDSIGDLYARDKNHAQATSAYRAALAIVAPIAERSPHNADRQEDLATTLERVADMELAARDFAGAFATYQRALAIIERIAAAQPANPRYRSHRALLLDNVGDVHFEAGRRAEAIATYRESVAMRQELFDRSTSSDDAKRHLATSLLKLGDAELKAGERDAGRASLRRALVLCEQLAAATDAKPQWAQLVRMIREILAKP
jgi:tetratricopeptide (TPR) repeat protein